MNQAIATPNRLPSSRAPLAESAQPLPLGFLAKGTALPC